MNFPPPLTRAELEWMSRKSSPGSTERRLLWEIKRLRSVVLRADQFIRSLGDNNAGVPTIIVDALRQELAAEACVQELRAVQDVMLRKNIGDNNINDKNSPSD